MGKPQTVDKGEVRGNSTRIAVSVFPLPMAAIATDDGSYRKATVLQFVYYHLRTVVVCLDCCLLPSICCCVRRVDIVFCCVGIDRVNNAC